MTRNFHYLALAPFALVVGSTLQAAPDPATALVAAEDGYTRAIIGKDLMALSKTLSVDLIYVHASGQAQDKPQYLNGTVEGGWRVVGARISERRANVYGDVGITLGFVAYDIGSGEKVARYMAVYRKERGKWLLLRWQNAKPTAPTAPAGSN